MSSLPSTHNSASIPQASHYAQDCDFSNARTWVRHRNFAIDLAIVDLLESQARKFINRHVVARPVVHPSALMSLERIQELHYGLSGRIDRRNVNGGSFVDCSDDIDAHSRTVVRSEAVLSQLSNAPRSFRLQAEFVASQRKGGGGRCGARKGPGVDWRVPAGGRESRFLKAWPEPAKTAP